MTTAVESLASKSGQEISAWGPVVIDPVTVERYWEALGFPGRSRETMAVPTTLLSLLPRRPVDVNRDVRPSEQVDKALGNPVNGGIAFTFSRPPRIGESIRGRVILKEAYVRQGKSGQLAIVVKQTQCFDADGRSLATIDHTTIYRGHQQ